MKNSLIFIAITSLLIVFISSCTIQKRVHNSGYHVHLTKSLSTASTNDIKSELKEESDQEEVIEEKVTSPIVKIRTAEKKKPIVPQDNSTDLKIEADIEQKNTRDVAVSSKVLLDKKVNKANETRKVDNNTLNLDGARPQKPTVHWGAVAGFICSIIGIFFAGIIMGLLAVIFSSIALSRISEDPELYSGSGLAIAGIVIGVIVLLLTLIAINAMLMA